MSRSQAQDGTSQQGRITRSPGVDEEACFASRPQRSTVNKQQLPTATTVVVSMFQVVRIVEQLR